MSRSGRPNKSDLRVEAIIYKIEVADKEKTKELLSEVGVDAAMDTCVHLSYGQHFLETLPY